jgi:DNA-binding LytR/AlgR family response regulator
MRVGKDIICPSEVQYCQGAGNYTVIMLHNGKHILSSHTLKFVTTLLKLKRSSKSFAVNPSYIKSLEDTNIVMQSGKEIPVSRRNLPEVSSFLKESL